MDSDKYRDKLFNLYVTKRLSPDVIGNIMGISERTVYHRLKEFGISRVGRHEGLDDIKTLNHKVATLEKQVNDLKRTVDLLCLRAARM